MFSADEEREVTRFLAQQHRTMSFQDAHFFNIHSAARETTLV
jgi:hypothetical protein